MPRGYRYIVCALVGWLTLCGAQLPAEKAEGSNSASQAAPAAQLAATPPTPAASPTPPFAAYPGYDPDPCYNAEGHDVADLCAQWRAAIAAEKAAHESRRATTWSIVATFLSFISLMAVICALRLTAKSNDIARMAVHTDLRAYLSVENVVVKTVLSPGEAGIDEPDLTIEITIRNLGSTPAKILSFAYSCVVDLKEREGQWPRPEPLDRKKFTGRLPQNGEETLSCPVFVGSALWRANQREWEVYFYGTIQYADVFQRTHTLPFSFIKPDEGFWEGKKMRQSPEGNDEE